MPIAASVHEYRDETGTPNRSRASRTSDGVAGPPPMMMARSDDRS